MEKYKVIKGISLAGLEKEEACSMELNQLTIAACRAGYGWYSTLPWSFVKREVMHSSHNGYFQTTWLIGHGFIEKIKEEQKTYSIGTIFHYNNGEKAQYMLCRVGIREICLIKIACENGSPGNRWREPVVIEGDHGATKKEMEEVAGFQFMRTAKLIE